MNILVTGATGFIGAWVVRALQKRNIDMILLDVTADWRRLEMLVDDVESLHFIQADIQEPGVFEKIFSEYSVQSVIHLAALQIPRCRADPVKGGGVNVIGFLRLFEAVKKLSSVHNVVYASSAAVYGPQEHYGDLPIPEDVVLKPVTHYGAFKVCNELCAKVYWMENQIPSIGLRPHTVYGFGRDVGVTSDITTALKAAVLRKPFKIRFGGKISLQYAADVAEAFVLAALTKPKQAKTYNLPGHVMSVLEAVQTINQLVPDSSKLITWDENPLPVAHTLDYSAFESEIHPLSITSVTRGFAETLEFFEKLNEKGLLQM